MGITANYKQYWYKKRKIETDPNAAFRHSTGKIDAINNSNTQLQPMDCMVTDPILEQIKAELSYYNYQVISGFEVYKNGIVETAADEQNLRAFQEANNLHPSEDDFHTNHVTDFFGQPSHLGMPDPVFDPINSPQQPMPGLGGY